MRSFLVMVAALGAAGFSVVSCGDDDSATGAGPGSGPNAASNGSAAQGSGGANASASSGVGAGGGEPTDYDCTPGTNDANDIMLTELDGDFSRPIFVTFAPGDNDTLYVAEQGGVIKVIQDGTMLPTAFLDISGEVRSPDDGIGEDEEGLLGLAFHPDYASNGRFFVHYSAEDNGDSTVFEYARSADPLVADDEGVQLVLRHSTQDWNHNGGSIAFGQDGYLYIAIGDGGGGDDTECDAQNPGNLLGKIMRLDVDGTPDGGGYPAAPGNPNDAKYYHIGLRNPWRMSFDACTDDLYIGDVGQDGPNGREEVNFVEPADGPTNFGWPVFEGSGAHGNDCPGDPANFPPLEEYNWQGGGAVMGGYVHRSAEAAQLKGYYFYADLQDATILMLRVEDGAVVDGPITTTVDMGSRSIVSFGQDGHGNLYVVDLNGAIFRIDPM
jgi:glucose/arabinose dehydrogenase